MIAYLKGVLTEKHAGHVVIECGGVGYMAGVRGYTLSALPPTGTEMRMEIYHHRTEADEKLFGFAEEEEKRLFEKLITVKGVGPKVALGVLSGMSPKRVADAIRSAQVKALSAAPGIGKKTAERIVLELADKLPAGDSGSGRAGESRGGTGSDAVNEAVSALEALGYKRSAAEKAVQDCLKEDGVNESRVQDLIKAGLQRLSR